MKRYLKYVKGKDGRLRMFGYEDNGLTKSLYGICYSSDFKEIEFLPNDYNKSAQELIEGGFNGE